MSRDIKATIKEREVMKSRGISVSFEVFPANTLKGLRKLRDTCSSLNALAPNFISVTFGAAGSSQLKTVRLVKQLSKIEIPTTPHLSCVGLTKERLEKLLNFYRECGIKRLIVIRGDIVPGSQFYDFTYASELVAQIRQLTGDHFHITVAAYPEVHPQAKSCQLDLHYFKHKVDAGADSAITQFFFNSDAFSRLREDCHKIGIKIPIIPGIMPINDYNKLLRFSGACGAEIPLWVRKQLDGLEGDAFSIKSKGVELVTKLCERLLVDGVEGLHFYTLNHVHPTVHIYRNLFSDKYQADYLNFLYAS